MEKNKKIIKLCYLQIAFYVVFLTSLLLHFKRGLDHRAFALLIILTLLGCASALTLTDYLKSLIRRSGFDVAGVHDKKSLEEKLLQLQNADDTLDVGVMMFDMNNLKMINDTYGHEEGDVFIQTFASYLTRILTEDSFLARFGGDEFVIIVAPEHYQELNRIIQEIKDIFMKPWFLKDSDYYCTMSMGVVEFPDNGEVVHELIKKADIAMYESKKAGKNRVSNYTLEIGSLSGRRLDMEKNMREATAKGNQEFEIFFHHGYQG